MAQVGRISGPLLFENLERQGKDLAFRNDLQTTQLLYLDVNTGRIAVNSDAAAVDIDISGTTRTNDIIGNSSGTAAVANFNISDSSIDISTGDINLDAAEAIVVPALETEGYRIDDNTISTTGIDSNLDLVPNGTGSVEVVNDAGIYGDLRASGNITFDGTVTFGDNAAQDTVDFNSDVDSDIDPDTTDTFALGSPSKKWNNLYVNLINGQTVETQDIAAGGTVLNSRPGNIFYVAANGNNSNVGDHIQGPLATVEEALSRADASTAGPVVIHIMPGTYEENFPLVVPPNVSITGHDLRNVVVKPTVSTNTNDAFHLNGETTIEKITVKDFYYDSVNNTGHAFRFAPGAVTSTRSPYIKDVTVITQGTTTSADDPRGFYSGDAGRGAYINGAEMSSSSVEASMLFHSATFITPGVDAITMTNGVRVEWLNSFTYFANRGLYAKNGLTGRTSQDGSTLNYGAEIRSIASANIYGNFGAVADGEDCLMYLIQHNMAYIGTAESVENDPGLVNQANEVVELNSGQIHFVTADQTGSFRVGDNFFVDFETGSTSIDTSTLTADTITGLVITNGGDTTTIDGRFVETGNFRIDDNTIQTLAGNFDIASETDSIDLNNNTSIEGSIDISGDFTFDGSISFAGDAPADAVTFNVELEQDFNPHETMAFNLGRPTKEWLAAYLNRLEVGDISIFDNRITTTISNADLELRANGTGAVSIDSPADITKNLTVSQNSSFSNVDISGEIVLNGNSSVSGNASYALDLTVDNNLNVGASAAFENIKIDDNIVTTTQSNSNLELRAAGSGKVKVDADFALGQSLSFSDGSVGNNFVVAQNTSTDNANIAELFFNDNFIQVTADNENLLVLSQQDVVVDNSISVSSLASLQNTDITGDLQHTGNRTQTGSYTLAGTLTIDSTKLEDNYIFVEELDTDLVLNPTGNVSVDSPVDLGQNLSVQLLSNLSNTEIQGELLQTGVRNQTGDYSLSGDFAVDDILVRDNFISSTNIDQDLIVTAAGTGKIIADFNSVDISNSFSVAGIANLSTTNITGNIQHVGDKTQTGNSFVGKNAAVDGTIDVASTMQTQDINISNNKISTSISNSNLELRAAGTGSINFNDSVFANRNLFVSRITSGDIIIDQDLDLNEIVIPPSIIEIDDNFISTTVSNADLELRASGAGQIRTIENITATNDFAVQGNAFLRDIDIQGLLTRTGNTNQDGSYTLSNDIVVDGPANFSSSVDIDNLQISGNSISAASSNLVLEASGTGSVVFDDLEVSADLSSSTLVTNNVIINGTFALEELESSTDVQIFDNVITTTNSNSNLELRTNSNGNINIQELFFNTDSLSTTADNITLVPAENVIINSTGALIIPIGTEDEIIEEEIEVLDGGTALANGSFLSGGDATTVFTASDVIYNAGEAVVILTGAPGSVRFNSDAERFEGFAGGRVTFGGVFSDDKQTRVTADTTNNTIDLIVNDNSIATLDTAALHTAGLQVEDVAVDNNTITTTVSNSDLEIKSQTAADIRLDDLSFVENTIKNNSNNLIISFVDNGYAKINSTIGTVIPSGSTAERPVADPEVGDTRFNTDDEIIEVWDGSTYVAAAGTSSTISEEDFNDLIFEYTLIFG